MSAVMEEEKKKFVCARCGAPVPEEDIENHRAGVVHEEVLCETHYREFLKKAAMETQILDEEGGGEEA